MKLQTTVLIQKFTEVISNEYPDLTDKEINDIVRSQYEAYSEHIASGNLPVIRAKYFGTFIPYVNRVKGMQKKLIDRFNKGNIDEEKFNEMNNNLNTYLNANTKD